jgi:hypothetical protein
LLLLAQNSLVAVAKDSNGIYWYLGKTRGIDMTANAASTGTAQGDRSGFTLTFTGSEPALAPSVLGTVASALETPGS